MIRFQSRSRRLYYLCCMHACFIAQHRLRNATIARGYSTSLIAEAACTYMQFLAARSLCMSLLLDRYSMPLATWIHMSKSRFLISAYNKKKIINNNYYGSKSGITYYNLSFDSGFAISDSLFSLRYPRRLPLGMKGMTTKGAGPPSRQTPRSVSTLGWSNSFIFAHSLSRL